jgi:hypothetical protein
MPVLFICLANSQKYKERCVAGIKIRCDENNELSISRKSKIDWIRPVLDMAHGQVTTSLVENIQILDVVLISGLRPVPNGYQSENVLFDANSIKKVRCIRPNKELFDVLSEETPCLLGNINNTIAETEIGKLTRSLILIKPSWCRFYRDDYQDKIKVKCEFLYCSNRYVLSVTDVKFKEKYIGNSNILQGINNYYLTISVGVKFNDLYYKLVAGVIFF